MKKLRDRDREMKFLENFGDLKIVPDILCFGSCTLLEWLIFFMKLGVKFHSFFSRRRVNFFSLSLFSRNESEIEMTGNREVKVK